MRITRVLGMVVAAGLAAAAAAQTAPMQPEHIPISGAHRGSTTRRREVMVPMRDGVKLFTVIIVGRQARADHPHRTPYHAANRAKRRESAYAREPCRWG
jgi:predicted acyl esterase